MPNMGKEAYSFAMKVNKKKPGRRRTPVYKPYGFGGGWVPPITIWRDEHGVYHTNFDISIYQPTGKTYYVDVTNGLDTNDGLTLATAFKTIRKAVDMVDVVVVRIAGGIYNRTNAFVNAAVTKSGSLAIKAIPGHNVRIVNCSPQVWTFHNQATYPNLYKSSVTGGTKVFDDKYHDDNDDMLEYVKVSDAATCDATPGTCFISGTTTYIHTIDNRVPDDSIMAMKDQLNAQFNDGLFYIDGISFEGGNNGACRVEKIATAPKAYFNNCDFKYAINDAGSAGGLTVLGASEVFLQNCIASRNLNDGFNYHAKTGTIANVIEVNCVGRNGGLLGDIDNGSTMHEGGKIVRVNCEYYETVGSVVGDINPNTHSWNVGCYSHDSKAVTEDRYKTCFTAHADARMWLEGCKADGSLNAVCAQDNAIVYIKDCDFEGNFFKEGTGKILDFEGRAIA